MTQLATNIAQTASYKAATSALASLRDCGAVRAVGRAADRYDYCVMRRWATWSAGDIYRITDTGRNAAWGLMKSREVGTK